MQTTSNSLGAEMKFKFNGQSMFIAAYQSPFYILGFLVGLLVDAAHYGYWVGSTYWSGDIK
jgi:hypothetical protein